MLSRDPASVGESRRDWIAQAIEEGIYGRQVSDVGRLTRRGDAKCFTDVT
ncbi:hypothetical protein QZM97_25570 [Burkholderia orbicola]|uniref:Uncharacterized protein n=1 Tax=Burkholderia orbicola TaxID=2978683 RepID=A0ABT8P0C6_9BURK|nr:MULTISPECIES: hypothetical protein [Burkholderia]EKS9841984.1 hypothetical protein [Burkholderia cepacia]BEV48512.1 hypothetical protein BconGalA64_10110 [Burkholderia contaminans]MBJ9669488.1 hypothetical protein [Burkholderia cenocepacia]MBJ9732486.1 hypothetical protein [Burkholderia cenocepacia]MBR8155031.1 hypothetical protein [Burkholderia cenocepacia]